MKKVKLQSKKMSVTASEEVMDLVGKCNAKINAFVAIELAKLQKRIRKQVKDELKGAK